MISLTEHPNSLLLRYQASIEKIDYEDEKVLIHYRQWSHRYDEWFDWTSPYLRPVERIQLRRQGLLDDDPIPVRDGLYLLTLPTRSLLIALHSFTRSSVCSAYFYLMSFPQADSGSKCDTDTSFHLFICSSDTSFHLSLQGFHVNDKVLASWSDCRFYPAKVLAVNKDGEWFGSTLVCILKGFVFSVLQNRGPQWK